MPGDYDQTLLQDAPEVSKTQRQEGYTLDLLQSGQGRRTPASAPSRTPAPTSGSPVPAGTGRATPAGSSENVYTTKETTDPEYGGLKNSSRRVPFYRTPRGMIIIAVAAIVVVAIAVGAGVGVSSKNNKKNNANFPLASATAAATATATPSAGDADHPHVSGPVPQASQVSQVSQVSQIGPTPSSQGAENPNPTGTSDNPNRIASNAGSPFVFGGEVIA